MKKTLKIIVLLTLLTPVFGCASAVPVGVLVTNINLPVIATENGGQTPKVGKSTCTSIFSLFAIGDASIDRAMKSRGITKVYHADWEATNILGIIGIYTLTVYGE